MQVITKPLTKEEIKTMADENNTIEVVILMDLDFIIENDLEGLLDEIAYKTVDDVRFHDIYYELAGTMNGQLLLKVSGDVSAILDEIDDEESEKKYEVAKYVKVAEEFNMDEEDVKKFIGHPFDEVSQIPSEKVVHAENGELYVISEQNF